LRIKDSRPCDASPAVVEEHGGRVGKRDFCVGLFDQGYLEWVAAMRGGCADEE
jgi:hypothetical protein